ncbi:MAG: hypothetical protein RMJ82_14030, partial [Gemmatales bacterium]|nr:hypothetical protein [Gemmatales bacterium]
QTRHGTVFQLLEAQTARRRATTWRTLIYQDAAESAEPAFQPRAQYYSRQREPCFTKNMVLPPFC